MLERAHRLAEHPRKDVVVGSPEVGLGEVVHAMAVVRLGQALDRHTDLGSRHESLLYSP